MNYQVLVFLVLGLTATMFLSKNIMLGFPCVIFWALLGGYAYTQSAATWDIDYFMFFASVGMAIFSALAANGLKTKKEALETGEEYIDESPDDTRYLDESRPGGDEGVLERRETDTGPRAQEVRDRAVGRRESLHAKANARRRRWSRGEL